MPASSPLRSSDASRVASRPQISSGFAPPAQLRQQLGAGEAGLRPPRTLRLLFQLRVQRDRLGGRAARRQGPRAQVPPEVRGAGRLPVELVEQDQRLPVTPAHQHRAQLVGDDRPRALLRASREGRAERERQSERSCQHGGVPRRVRPVAGPWPGNVRTIGSVGLSRENVVSADRTPRRGYSRAGPEITNTRPDCGPLTWL